MILLLINTKFKFKKRTVLHICIPYFADNPYPSSILYRIAVV
nr:MAG TPA: hypothetical protein [Bacteriophage sp.]